MGDNHAGKLLRSAEAVAYWGAAAPVLARLPAALGYRIACWRGDWLFRCQPGKRTEVGRNLRLALANELSPAAVQQANREWFRFASCEAVDVKRLRHRAQPLRRLVEIHGREHLEAALAAGQGAILCTGHFGSLNSGLSVLHASGFPVTAIARWPRARPPSTRRPLPPPYNYNNGAGMSSAEQWLWDRVYVRPVRRHRQRPNIEPWPGRPEVAALAAAALRANEVVTICIDTPPLDSDRARAVEVPFLGRRTRLLPGAVALAQVTGAPLLMGFLYRAADYRHQVWEISAPVPAEGEAATVFERCADEVNAAIRRSPAHWGYWYSTGELTDLGLLRPQPDRPPAAGPGPSTDGRYLRDGSTDSVSARGRPLPGARSQRV